MKKSQNRHKQRRSAKRAREKQFNMWVSRWVSTLGWYPTTSSTLRGLALLALRRVDYSNLRPQTKTYGETVDYTALYRRLVDVVKDKNITVVTAEAPTAEQRKSFLSRGEHVVWAGIADSGRSIFNEEFLLSLSDDHPLKISRVKNREFSSTNQDYITPMTSEHTKQDTHCGRSELALFAAKSCVHYPCNKPIVLDENTDSTKPFDGDDNPCS